MSKVRDKKRAKGRAHAAKVKERNQAAGPGMSQSFIDKCFKRGKLDRDEIHELAEQEAERKARSHHKGDLPRFGAGIKARQQVQSTLNRMMAGSKGVRVEAELVELVGDRQRPVPGTKFEVGDPSVKMPEPVKKVTTFSNRSKHVDDEGALRYDETGGKVWPDTDTPHPSIQQWGEVVVTARQRKRSIKSIAEKKGYTLIGEDPKDRESWRT